MNISDNFLIEKRNKPARSPYSLEIRLKLKNQKTVFLDTDKKI